MSVVPGLPGSPQSSVVGVIYTSQIGRIYPSQPQTSASSSTAASGNGGGIIPSAAAPSSAITSAPPDSPSSSSSSLSSSPSSSPSSSVTPTTSSTGGTNTEAAGGLAGGTENPTSSLVSTTSATTSNVAQSSITGSAPTSSQTAGAGGAGLTAATSSNHHYRNHVVIPAAVVCSVVGALLIALLLWFCIFRKRRKNRASKDSDASAAAAINRYSPDVDDEKQYTLPRVDTGTPGLGHGMPFAGAATAAPFMAAGYHKERGPGTGNRIPFAATGPLAMTAVPYMTAGLHKETDRPAAAASPTRRSITSSPTDASGAPWVAQPLRHFRRQSLRSNETSSPAGEALQAPDPIGSRDSTNMPGSDQRSYAPASPPSYTGSGSAASGLGAAALGGAALTSSANPGSANPGSANTQAGAPSTASPRGPLPVVPSSQQQYHPYRQPSQDYEHESGREPAYATPPAAAVGAMRAREASTPTRPELIRGLSALEEASIEDSASLYSEGRRDAGPSGLSSIGRSQRHPRDHDAYEQPSYDQIPMHGQSSYSQPASETPAPILNFAGGTFYSDRDSLQRQSLDTHPLHGGTFLESPRDSGLPQTSRPINNEPESNPRPSLGARAEYYTAPTGLGFGPSSSQPDPRPRDQSQNSVHTRDASSGLWSGLTDSSDSTSGAGAAEPPLYRSGTVASGTGRIHEGAWGGRIARGGPSGAAISGVVPETSDDAPRSEVGSEDWASGSQPDSSRRQSGAMLAEEGWGYKRDSVREVLMGRSDGAGDGRGSDYATPSSGEVSNERSIPRKPVDSDGVGLAR